MFSDKLSPPTERDVDEQPNSGSGTCIIIQEVWRMPYVVCRAVTQFVRAIMNSHYGYEDPMQDIWNPKIVIHKGLTRVELGLRTIHT